MARWCRPPSPASTRSPLYLDKREIVTLMTLGHAPEALVIGYLRNQRLVDVDRATSTRCRWTGKPIPPR